MNIHGFTKTTLLDYPGHVASTIFTGGCNFRCPFCHNYELVLTPDVFPLEEENKIFDFLKKRKGILTGVAISGGEPTLDPDLENFILKLKELDYMVKLDTNGYRPDVVLRLIDKDLIDYVAMDIKSGRDNYARATGLDSFDLSKIDYSLQILSESDVSYELRTTAVCGLHTSEDFEDIASWIPSSSNYFIQKYKETPGINNPGYMSFSDEQLAVFADIIRTKVASVNLRGID